jgi:hypothetical protein
MTILEETVAQLDTLIVRAKESEDWWAAYVLIEAERMVLTALLQSRLDTGSVRRTVLPLCNVVQLSSYRRKPSSAPRLKWV